MTEMHYILEMSTCDPLKCKMGIPFLIYQNAWENPSEQKALNRQLNPRNLLGYTEKEALHWLPAG